jgi:hypothetical protein
VTMRRKLQVFVSSTYSDLTRERQAAVETVLAAGHIPAGMELFAAGNESQLEVIRRWIDESDVFMLLLGGRYGSLDPQTQRSYTELEYDYAVSTKKPVFALVITDRGLDQKVAADGRAALESQNPHELKRFREKVLTRISAFFTDAKDIKVAIFTALTDLQARHKFSGWVAGSEVPDLNAVLSELANLRSERDAAVTRARDANLDLERLGMALGGIERWTQSIPDPGAEIAVREFLSNAKFVDRSFETLSRHLGGFAHDELRKDASARGGNENISRRRNGVVATGFSERRGSSASAKRAC